MRLLFASSIFLVFVWAFTACNSSSGKASFCDTTCNNDTIRFATANPDNPFLYISVKDCEADTVAWGHDYLATNRKMDFEELTGSPARLHKDFVRAYIKDTSYVWLTFNNCDGGQGYILKIPYSKEFSIFRKNSAFNPMDKKYAIDDNLVAWSDRGNIFVEDMETGKQAMMTFGEETSMDFTDMHATVDSVNITTDRIWVNVRLKDGWKPLQKTISLK